MSTATMHRPALRPQPGPRPGALVAPGLDPRPCVTNPPQWWDTGHKNNADAIDLCRTQCPLFGTGQCKPLRGETGTIRDGIAYDDRGKPADIKNLPHHHHDVIAKMRAADKSFADISHTLRIPITTIRDYCKSHGISTERPGGKVSEYHDTIAAMRAAGVGWQKIADRIHKDREAVRAYWLRYQQSQAVDAVREAVAA